MAISVKILFGVSLATAVYTYVGYPVCAWLISRAIPYNLVSVAVQPEVDVLLSVFNAEKTMEAKIRNFLALDYPPEKVRLLIGADGCTDATADLAKRAGNPRIILIEEPVRHGKTAMLNKLAQISMAPVLVFTDGDSFFRPDALKRLVASLADPRVGLVTGRTCYLAPNGNQERLRSFYVRYEGFIREAEGRLRGVVGADGAVYALRRELWTTLPERYINDFYHPIQAAKEGYRTVYDPGAIVEEVASERPSNEFQRQLRMAAQQLFIFFREFPRLLSRRKLLYLGMLTSHKFLRWMTLPILACVIAAGIPLSAGSLLVRLVLAGLGVMLALALVGLLFADAAGNRVVRIAAYFLLVNMAYLGGLWKLARGNVFVTWQPRGK